MKGKLKELLREIATGEKQMERHRLRKGLPEEHGILQIFHKIDRYGKGRISTEDLQLYLRNKAVSCSQREVKMLFESYDANRDGKLSLNEFFRLLCSAHDNATGWLNEEQLVMLMQIEIKVLRNIETKKLELVHLPGFNIGECYRTIENRDLQQLLEVSAEDLGFLFRRVDRNADGVIGYFEFIDAVLPSDLRFRAALPRSVFKSTGKSICQYKEDTEGEVPVKPLFDRKKSPLRDNAASTKEFRTPLKQARTSPRRIEELLLDTGSTKEFE